MQIKQQQTIGKSKDFGRICLWNRAMIANGFPIGQTISITQRGTRLTIQPDANGKRKVSGVINHGTLLPVIDLKQTKAVNIAAIGNIGDSVTVKFTPNKITITKAE